MSQFDPSITKNLEEIFDSLKNAPKQKQLLMGIFGSESRREINGNNSKELLHKTSSTPDILRTLISKGIFGGTIHSERIVYFTILKNKIEKRKLSKAQQKGISIISMKAFEEKSVVLLQGVTGSGKTEVYMEIDCPELISKGRTGFVSLTGNFSYSSNGSSDYRGVFWYRRLPFIIPSFRFTSGQ